MSIEAEIKAFVADLPAPMAEADLQMIRGLIARVELAETWRRDVDKRIGSLEAEIAKMQAA